MCACVWVEECACLSVIYFFLWGVSLRALHFNLCHCRYWIKINIYVCVCAWMHAEGVKAHLIACSSTHSSATVQHIKHLFSILGRRLCAQAEINASFIISLSCLFLQQGSEFVSCFFFFASCTIFSESCVRCVFPEHHNNRHLLFM